MKKGLVFLLLYSFSHCTIAMESAWQFNLETGVAYQTVNDVQIPGDTGTRFSLVDAIGKGPVPYFRFETKYRINEKHRLRLLIAPLDIEKNGTLNKDVVFDDGKFSSNENTKYRYKFNSYRLTYAYRVLQKQHWNWDIGFTAKIRDAEITLTQGSTKSSYPNIGFVPLFHSTLEKKINDSWQAQIDIDAIASPFGRAIDLGIFSNYTINKSWKIGAGYRTVEGGADNDKVYTFAWLHYFGLRINYAI